jgi:hypothetical protein
MYLQMFIVSLFIIAKNWNNAVFQKVNSRDSSVVDTYYLSSWFHPQHTRKKKILNRLVHPCNEILFISRTELSNKKKPGKTIFLFTYKEMKHNLFCAYGMDVLDSGITLNAYCLMNESSLKRLSTV